MLEYRREMAEFIKSNFNKRSFFDKKFLEEMRQVALLGRKNTYIDSITSEFITFKDINTCATYDEENIRIYIFNKFLHCLLYTKKYKIKLNFDVFKIFNYVSILHEIMHSYQLDMLINDKNQDILYSIIKHSMLVSAGDINLSGKKICSYDERRSIEFYQQNYFIFPEERQAELSALYFILQVYREFKPKSVATLYNVYKFLIYYGIKEYSFKDKVSCPLMRFYKSIDRLDLFYNLEFSINSLKDKFIYGMPLAREELYKVCYPFVNYNDSGKIFFEKESIARKIWVKKYAKC